MTIDEELISPFAYGSFSTGNLLSNSSAVLNEDTALEPDLCTHRDLKRDFYICV